jgi:putative addiction module component (TIGR02574 family)
MSKAEILEELRQMPEAERRDLIETIEQEFGEFDDELSAEQIAELECRAEELRKRPETGIPWTEVRSDAKQRLNSRRMA